MSDKQQKTSSQYIKTQSCLRNDNTISEIFKRVEIEFAMSNQGINNVVAGQSQSSLLLSHTKLSSVLFKEK